MMLFERDRFLAAGLSDLLIKLDKMYASGEIQKTTLDTLNATIYQMVDAQCEGVQNYVNRSLVKHYTGYNVRKRAK